MLDLRPRRDYKFSTFDQVETIILYFRPGRDYITFSTFDEVAVKKSRPWLEKNMPSTEKLPNYDTKA